MTRSNDTSTEGFALIEALVALAIFATMTALLYQAVVSSASLQRRISDKKLAVLIAQSALDQIDGNDRSSVTGQIADLEWKTEARRYADGAAGGSNRLEYVLVSVSSRSTGRIILEVKSLRLAAR
jgi:type II secretion system protein I